ncbi:hypothetical protein [Candidatus Enterococcus mansonii]|uniref:Uncharacterized protein n=2 Tax=Candidatus Enterococcus mansonii TaxID=1834181 RepID=A0ABU8IC51_9ENTE
MLNEDKQPDVGGREYKLIDLGYGKMWLWVEKGKNFATAADIDVTLAYNKWLSRMIDEYGLSFIQGDRPKGIDELFYEQNATLIKELKTGIDSVTGKKLTTMEMIGKASLLANGMITLGVMAKGVINVGKVKNATPRNAGEVNPSKTDFGAENPVSGKDWNNYFKDKYGAGNVQWKNPVNSIDDIINTPSSLTNVNPTDIVDFVKKEGWIVTPLKKGGNAGIPYEQGGGFSMNPPAGTSGSSRYIQYHPGGGHHGELPYYKVSSPEHGITRIYTNGKVVKE